MPRKEKHLLKLIAKGNTSAFRVLFNEYFPKVKVFMEGYTSDGDDASDLAQNIFVKLWSMREKLSDIKDFGAYLHRICRNTALDYCKSHRNGLSLREDNSETFSLDEDYIAREMRSRMYERIRLMPERRRRVITLSRIEGKSNDEIASMMGISKKTVENHLNAALGELRKLMS